MASIKVKRLQKMLDEYLRFRHLFRKRYGFELEWTSIKRLLKKMPDVYTAIEGDIQEAIKEEK